MSDPNVIYLGPPCQEQGQLDGREWCQDDVWDTCECGHESVRYNLGVDFDRVVAERDDAQACLELSIGREDALQALLTAADERADKNAALAVGLAAEKHAIGERANVLEGLLREARQHHGVMLMNDPPQDAWKFHRMNERIDAALKPSEGLDRRDMAAKVHLMKREGAGDE